MMVWTKKKIIINKICKPENRTCCSDVHVLLRQCWLIGKTRSVGSPDLLPVTTSLDVGMQGLTETANGFDTVTDGQVLNHGEQVR